MSANHRKLVYNAITSANTEAMLRAYHARGIDLGYCNAGISGPSMSLVVHLGWADLRKVLLELSAIPNTPHEEAVRAIFLSTRSNLTLLSDDAAMTTTMTTTTTGKRKTHPKPLARAPVP